jgi:MFS transporter, UMF1 family
MYDLANQSFQLLIKTLLFSLYVESVVATDPASGTMLWTRMSAFSMFLIAVLAPIIGSIADRFGWRRELLLMTGVISAVFTGLLAYVGPGDFTLCFILFVIAAAGCGLGENLLSSFLPEISTSDNIGFVSALGWTMSYVGALILLTIVTVYSIILGYEDAADFRPIFVFAGVWFLAGMIPAFLWLRERTSAALNHPDRSGSNLIAETIRSFSLVKRFPQLLEFVGTYFIYNLGISAVLYFLGSIGTGLGFKLDSLLKFALVVTVSAGFSSATTAKFQDRMGHKRTLLLALFMWMFAMLAIAGTQYFHAPPWTFWMTSSMAGLALGSAGTATRAVVGALTPAQHSAEFFGLFGMSTQVSGILGVVTFGVLKVNFGQAIAVLMLAVFFASGILLLLRLNLEQGFQAARTSEARCGIPD